MEKFFCAEESRNVGEDPIGNGETFPVYILIECPPPWTRNAFNSKLIPTNLKILQQETESTDSSIAFLLIYNEHLQQKNSTRVIIYHHNSIVSKGYGKYEFTVSNINDVAPILRNYLLNNKLDIDYSELPTRDILVCTHGSRDQCCAKYGNPFYRQAKQIVHNLSLNDVRIWQSSHFGGHRFAPTAIDFPQGRYYARLDADSFTAILTRTGNIELIKPIYRGWGILPTATQVLEREMMLMYGWEWFDYKVAAQILEQSEDEYFQRVELSFIRPNGRGGLVQADVIVDKNKICHFISYCDGKEKESIPQFCIKNMLIYSDDK